MTRGKPALTSSCATELLGIPPRQCLVLEDSEAGRAAAAAGMACIIVPDLKQPSPEVAALATAVLPDLGAVTAWFQSD
ncbi:MAG: hypothetical protein HZY76_10985 [Anaerolineae bacterium]|nr:MAG: hypothetical protein HZY76_10985 [Anaerolineae bacterium]